MNSFDERAAFWDIPERIERAKFVAEAIINKVAMSSVNKALEYGCGTGLLSFALKDHAGDVTLADVSDGMLKVLSEKIIAAGAANFKTLKLDLITDPLPDEKYDLIYTLLTLHHIDDVKKILRQFHEILNENGFIAVADLDKEDGTFHGKGFTGHNGFDRNEFKSLVESCGFENISYQTPYIIKREVNGVIKNFPLFLMTARKTLN